MYLNLHDISKKIRKNIIEVTYKVGVEGSHIGGALSATDLLTVLYAKFLKYDLTHRFDELRDRFILSKGHTAIALYAVLKEFGFITSDELDSFETDGSHFQTHCVQNIEKGIEISSGSLGWGLSVSIGMQLQAKRTNKSFYNYVLLGNGECNEGSIWESAMLASQLKLSHLIAILDNNHMQLDGDSDEILNSQDFAKRFEAFGWNTIEIDGHNFDEIEKAFIYCKECNDKPSIIIANTIKGKGISFLENNPQSHHMSLTKDQYEQALAELN